MDSDTNLDGIGTPQEVVLADDVPDWAKWDDNTDNESETESESTENNADGWVDELFEKESDSTGTEHATRNPKEEQEGRLTVTVRRNNCSNCGSTTLKRHHAGCEAPIIDIGGEWVCANCGASMTQSDSCAVCGSTVSHDAVEIGVDLSLSAVSTGIERAVHEETNRRRTDHGIRTLDYSNHLSAIALQYSRDMAQRDFFDHVSPEGNGPSDRYRKFGHDTQSYGENLALTNPSPGASVENAARSVVDDWMNSKGHRENILTESFSREGIGVYFDSNGGMYSTQNFY
jgi:uncharacterized protein YkwD